MRIYLLALGSGLIVGALYSLLGVRSPAPPVIALVGLLGILLGEQALPLVRQALAPSGGQAAAAALTDCAHHVLGRLPGRAGVVAAAPPASRATDKAQVQGTAS